MEAITSRDLADLPREPELVRYNTDGGIPSYDFLSPNNHWYEIVAKNCRTTAELTDWIHHMCEKTWVTTRHIKQFVLLWELYQRKRKIYE